MLRKLLFQCHWLIGITLGTLLAFSGLTGGLMAFGPELTDFFSGGYQRIDGRGAQPLEARELYERVRAALPDRRIVEATTWSEPGRPARVRLAVAQPFIGPTAPIPETRYLDPYTGELLPARPFGQAVERAVHWLRDVHQGHWGGPTDVAARLGGLLVGLSTVFLFFIALSGLYLRWPRGAARRWRSWFAIYPKLKGRAFLWNLHAVLGTCVLLVYLVSAHSGSFQSGPMEWYGNSVRALLGLPPAPRPGGPPGGPPGRDPNTVRLIAMHPGGYFNVHGDAHGATTSLLDVRTGAVSTPPPRPAARTLGEKLAANNQNIHEGRILGRVGVLVMMLAALCMPAFCVTGWMMYLKRRRSARAAAPAAHELDARA